MPIGLATRKIFPFGSFQQSSGACRAASRRRRCECARLPVPTRRSESYEDASYHSAMRGCRFVFLDCREFRRRKARQSLAVHTDLDRERDRFSDGVSLQFALRQEYLRPGGRSGPRQSHHVGIVEGSGTRDRQHQPGQLQGLAVGLRQPQHGRGRLAAGRRELRAEVSRAADRTDQHHQASGSQWPAA